MIRCSRENDSDADSAGSDNEGDRCVIESTKSSLDDANDSDDSGGE